MDEPLGVVSGSAAAPRARRWRVAWRALAGIAALAAAIGLIALAGRNHPLGGEPFAVAKVEVAPAPAPPQPAPPEAHKRVQEAVAPAIGSADQVEAASGVKVTRVGGGGPPNALIIDVPRALAVRLEAAPDARLVESSRYGLLPRVGADGARPFEVYARPIVLDPTLKAGSPRIALMVGGLGLNAEGTRSAIANLPGAVTLGFAPYGAAIEERAAEARGAGHETALQAPMEDFLDSADGPGPHTLKTSASDSDNLDSLRWLMSRFHRLCGGRQLSRRQIHRREARDIAGSEGNRGARPRLSRRRLLAAQRGARRRHGAGHAIGPCGRRDRRQCGP
jgi:uncharacterized protein